MNRRAGEDGSTKSPSLKFAVVCLNTYPVPLSLLFPPLTSGFACGFGLLTIADSETPLLSMY